LFPLLGDSFVFLNAGSLTGEFSYINRQVFGYGTLQWSVTYEANRAILTVGANVVPDGGSTLLLLMLALSALLMCGRLSLRMRN
jgi:protein with PEP-CTERM/exosortase system signal